MIFQAHHQKETFAHIFIRKSSSEIKVQTCADGCKQCIHSNKEDNESPTTATKSAPLTAMIEAKEEYVGKYCARGVTYDLDLATASEGK